MLVYIVDDEKRIYRVIKKFFPEVEVRYFPDGPSLFGALEERLPDLVLVDLVFKTTSSDRLLSKNLPEKEGLAISERIKEKYPELRVYLISRYADMDVLGYLSRKGIEFLDTGWDDFSLKMKLERALGREDPPGDHGDLQKTLAKFGFYTASPRILFQVKELDLSPGSREKVLFVGETGTGKNTLAMAVHKIVNGTSAPFLSVHLPTVPDSLFESEIFGYEKGAFTGAETTKRGVLDRAAGGTVFFDEIALIGERLQSKLLQLLEAPSFFRVGGTRAVPIKAKIMGATMMGKVMPALRFRFHKVIYLPPLRERREDVAHMVEVYRRKGLKLTPSSERFLKEEADYPGNMRMLVNILEELLRSGDGSLERTYEAWRQHLKDTDGVEETPGTGVGLRDLVDWMRRNKKSFREMEDEILVALLKEGASTEEIMALLGIGRTTFFRKKKELAWKMGKN